MCVACRAAVRCCAAQNAAKAAAPAEEEGAKPVKPAYNKYRCMPWKLRDGRGHSPGDYLQRAAPLCVTVRRSGIGFLGHCRPVMMVLHAGSELSFAGSPCQLIGEICTSHASAVGRTVTSAESENGARAVRRHMHAAPPHHQKDDGMSVSSLWCNILCSNKEACYLLLPCTGVERTSSAAICGIGRRLQLAASRARSAHNAVVPLQQLVHTLGSRYPNAISSPHWMGMGKGLGGPVPMYHMVPVLQARMTVFSALAFLPVWAKFTLVPDFLRFAWWLVWVRILAVAHVLHRAAVMQGGRPSGLRFQPRDRCGHIQFSTPCRGTLAGLKLNDACA